ncbi:hypothetical protein [Streptococcus minor]|uniref:hypothetical protein n=1 Tax=Streptococcus minor TaxID=229549 RepID=UPI00039E515B|nr:hypothetical protein [Streptococcus minor]
MRSIIFKKSLTALCLVLSLVLLASCSQKKTKPSTSTSHIHQKQSATTEVTTSTTPTTEMPTIPSTSQPTPASIIPAEAIGTWEGASQLAPEVRVTISADGQINTYSHFVYGGEGGIDDVQEYTATITELKNIAPNTYIIMNHTGQVHALLPGITNIGGTFVMLAGFKIENGQYRPIAVIGPTVEEIDYQNYHDFGFALSK